jgi:hypothetical protein
VYKGLCWQNIGMFFLYVFLMKKGFYENLQHFVILER